MRVPVTIYNTIRIVQCKVGQVTVLNIAVITFWHWPLEFIDSNCYLLTIHGRVYFLSLHNINITL